MNDASRSAARLQSRHKVRFVTAASLFDGHDASINIMRRILQVSGCEVIHLGHNRVGRGDRQLRAAGRRARHRDLVLPGRARRVLQVHDRPAARARRPHQGVRRRRRRDRARRDQELHDYGVARIFSPEDGPALGLQG
jgi:methylmalonyl-CoA mutase